MNGRYFGKWCGEFYYNHARYSALIIPNKIENYRDNNHKIMNNLQIINYYGIYTDKLINWHEFVGDKVIGKIVIKVANIMSNDQLKFVNKTRKNHKGIISEFISDIKKGTRFNGKVKYFQYKNLIDDCIDECLSNKVGIFSINGILMLTKFKVGKKTKYVCGIKLFNIGKETDEVRETFGESNCSICSYIVEY